jgi:translation initiation factor 1A
MPGKKKKKKHRKPREAVKRDLVFKNFQEEYAVITKKLGDRRMIVQMPDMKTDNIGIIPGRFRKRCWFDIGDLCLVSFREYQDNKVDIIYKYTPDERRSLHRTGEIPIAFASGSADVSSADVGNPEEDAFEFTFDEI